MKNKAKIPSKVKVNPRNFKMFFYKNGWNSGCLGRDV